MIITEVSVQNFGSFAELEFNFEGQGLALMSGPTGSGKSTLLDIAPWILYGQTSKGGSIDDIRPWNDTKEITIGVITVTLASKDIMHVTRSRGQGKNDLYWTWFDDSGLQRGKDLKDSQAQLNGILGLSYDEFIAGCYFNEFSSASKIFTGSSKDRREVFDKLADLSLPTKLIAAITLRKKTLVKIEQDSKASLLSTIGNQNHCESLQLVSRRKSETFEADKARRLADLERLSAQHEVDQTELIAKLDEDISITYPAKIEAFVPNTCITCGRSDNSEELMQIQAQITQLNFLKTRAMELVNPYIQHKSFVTNEENHYAEQLAVLDSNMKELAVATTNITGYILGAKKSLALLDQLEKIVAFLKVKLLEQVVLLVQRQVNAILAEYFDAELQVSFTASEGDTLDVELYKNGHQCVYKQLSKGQKQLLKLAFAVSVMITSANNIGVDFNCMLFDEALDGLDVNMKLKAHRLFEWLATQHSSILVVDHSEELKAMFGKVYSVSMVDDKSVLHE